MEKIAHERTLIESVFLAIGQSIPMTFLHTILNGIKLLPGETDFKKHHVFFRYYSVFS